MSDRDKLKQEIKTLDDMTVRFNDLHRRAKYLKKDMVKQRYLIAELERKINSKKSEG
jgi:hypothetical protein